MIAAAEAVTLQDLSLQQMARSFVERTKRLNTMLEENTLFSSNHAAAQSQAERHLINCYRGTPKIEATLVFK